MTHIFFSFQMAEIIEYIERLDGNPIPPPPQPKPATTSDKLPFKDLYFIKVGDKLLRDTVTSASQKFLKEKMTSHNRQAMPHLFVNTTTSFFWYNKKKKGKHAEQQTRRKRSRARNAQSPKWRIKRIMGKKWWMGGSPTWKIWQNHRINIKTWR